MNSKIEYNIGDVGERPWGSWKVLAVDQNFVIKRIDVKPGHRLSLQRHHHRSEHWTIIIGEAKITIGDTIKNIGLNDTVFIPAKTKHQIQNESYGTLSFIEIQTGPILDEDDIERFADDYGRAS